VDIEQLRAELHAQDRALAAARERLAELGDLDVSILPSFFSELEELTEARTTPIQTTPRSAIRA